MKNAAKKKIADGKKILGTFFEMGGTTAAQCLGLSGIDFFIIDAEHGPFDVESVKELVLATAAYAPTPFVRVKDGSRSSVLKMLDVGAQGLVIPNIHSVDEVRQVVAYGKYHPVGQRGFAPTTVSGFGFAEYAKEMHEQLRVSNAETLLLPQCETVGCLENIEEIAGIDGVDGIFVGPYDLSIALGKPADFGAPEFDEAVERILSACKRAGKLAFIYAGTREAVIANFNRGFDAVAYSMDTIQYINTYQQIIADLEAAR